MIIDSHVHIGSLGELQMTEEDVLYSMEQYGIDYSIVSDAGAVEFDHQQQPIPPELQFTQLQCAQRAVCFAQQHPDKIGAAVWLKPYNATADQEIYDYIRKQRAYIKALKFHPYHSVVEFDSDRMEPYMEMAAFFHLPVVTHTGGCDAASCLRVYHMAKRHPEINFVMVHMGLGTDHREAIALAGKLPNLYGDTTWVPMEDTIEFIRQNGDEKILFGSDSPIDGKDTYLCNRYGQRSIYQDYFHILPERIPSRSYDRLMFENAQRLFQLQ